MRCWLVHGLQLSSGRWFCSPTHSHAPASASAGRPASSTGAWPFLGLPTCTSTQEQWHLMPSMCCCFAVPQVATHCSRWPQGPAKPSSAGRRAAMHTRTQTHPYCKLSGCVAHLGELVLIAPRLEDVLHLALEWLAVADDVCAHERRSRKHVAGAQTTEGRAGSKALGVWANGQRCKQGRSAIGTLPSPHAPPPCQDGKTSIPHSRSPVTSMSRLGSNTSRLRPYMSLSWQGEEANAQCLCCRPEGGARSNTSGLRPHTRGCPERRKFNARVAKVQACWSCCSAAFCSQRALQTNAPRTPRLELPTWRHPCTPLHPPA